MVRGYRACRIGFLIMTSFLVCSATLSLAVRAKYNADIIELSRTIGVLKVELQTLQFLESETRAEAVQMVAAAEQVAQEAREQAARIVSATEEAAAQAVASKQCKVRVRPSGINAVDRKFLESLK